MTLPDYEWWWVLSYQPPILEGMERRRMRRWKLKWLLATWLFYFVCSMLLQLSCMSSTSTKGGGGEEDDLEFYFLSSPVRKSSPETRAWANTSPIPCCLLTCAPIYYFYSNSANFFLPLPPLSSKLLQMHNSNTFILFNNHVTLIPPW